MLNIKIPIIIITFLLFAGCNTGQTNNTPKNSGTKTVVAKTTHAKTDDISTGYRLMKQKCFICHLETPDPAKRGQMIAPPMVRVQQHYKPAYPTKEAFVKAVVAYVKNPSEAKTLMPGAVKRFKIMPKLIYDDKELQLIASALFETNFNNPGAMERTAMQQAKLQLNNGEKWKLKKQTMQKVNVVVSKLQGFHSDNLSAYHQLGKDIFNLSKALLLDKSYKNDLYKQLQAFFHGIEDNMHTLMSAKDITTAQQQTEILKKKFNRFYQYFE